MRLFFRALILFLALALAFIYIIVPKNKTVKALITLDAPSLRVITFLGKSNEWKKWWPEKDKSNDSVFTFKDEYYKIIATSENGVRINIRRGDDLIEGNITVAATSRDSCMVEWVTDLEIGSNPFKKIAWYFYSNDLKKDMAAILQGLKSYLAKKENIYGLQVNLAKVTDTALVAIRKKMDHSPSTSEVYSLVGQLREYIRSQNAQETNFPMLHVLDFGASQYEIMVGIPTNKLLPGKGEIEQKRMVAGNILWAEVRGGNEVVNEAFRQLENFKYDNRLTSPAIPFALLVTDRTMVTDSTKWITKVYSPIF